MTKCQIIEVLNGTGLILNLAGSIILAASLLGLERIANLRNYFRTRRFASYLKRFRARDGFFEGRKIPDSKEVLITLLWLPLYSILILLPFLVFAITEYILQNYFLINRIVAYIISYLFIGGCLGSIIIISDLRWMWKSRKRTINFSSIPVRYSASFLHSWPLYWGGYVLLALIYGLESLLAYLFRAWLQIANKAKRISEDRFIGLLGIFLLGLGFFLQFVALLMD